MAQSETVLVTAPAGSLTAVRPEPTRISLRTWGPRVAMLLAMGAGVLMANLLPAIIFNGGGTPLSEVAAAVTAEGNGWVMTLVWLAGLIALISVFVFPPEERFIQTVAISLGSLVVLVLPLYVSRNLTVIEPQATGLGPGLLGMTVAYLAAAALPWINLLWWNRAKPVLGTGWQKWLFIGPAAFWILGLTIFPLAYAITTSRYAFRTGKIVKDVGWGNYRKLFNDVLFDPATRGQAIVHTVVVGLGAALAVLVIGGILGLLSDERSFVQSARRAATWIPLAVVPAVLLSLSGDPNVLPTIFGQHLPLAPVLDKDVSFTLSITYVFVAGAVAVEMILGFLLALLFNREMRARSVLRTIITLPIFATPVAIGFLGRTIFYEGGGPVNSFLQIFGLNPPPWLSNPNLGADHDDHHRRLGMDAAGVHHRPGGPTRFATGRDRGVVCRWRGVVGHIALHHATVDGSDTLADPAVACRRCVQGLRSGGRDDPGWSWSGHPLLLVLQLPDGPQAIFLR